VKALTGRCLGSEIDEERSKRRYLVRIADLLRYQNFERNLRLISGMLV